MDIKDTLVKIYVKKYVIPKALIFDKPGFVDFKISGKTRVFARQLIVPESFFSQFENDIVAARGTAGAKKLYSVGKRFGYSFAQLGRFENIKDHPGEGIKDWVIIATKFIEGTYAENISQTIEIQSKTVEYTLTNFVVCEKLGYDYFLAQGGAAGLTAWILQDKTIEGCLLSSKKEGEKQISVVVCAPEKELQTKYADKEILEEQNLTGLEHDAIAYESFNSEVNFTESTSFQAYLNSRLFGYSEGKVTHQNERFFLLEATAMYLIEKEFSDENISILAKSAFQTGGAVLANIGSGKLNDLSEVLTALGWGKVTILSAKPVKIAIEHFPWTKYYENCKYIIISNFLAGALSKILNRKIQIDSCKKDLTNGYLNLLLEEK